jgi:hypothetical protein
VKPIYRPSVIWAFVAPVSAACIVVFALCVSHYQKATMVIAAIAKREAIVIGAGLGS